jgi:hypothetical protein
MHDKIGIVADVALREHESLGGTLGATSNHIKAPDRIPERLGPGFEAINARHQRAHAASRSN